MTKNWKDETGLEEEESGFDILSYRSEKMSEIVHEPEDGLHAHVRDIALVQVVVVEQGPEAHPGVCKSTKDPSPGIWF